MRLEKEEKIKVRQKDDSNPGRLRQNEYDMLYIYTTRADSS